MCAINKRVSLLVGVLLFFNTLLALAQLPAFWHLSMERGLSNADVTSIFQDSQGFMWIGTMDGLNRYDGYEMKIYRKNAKDTLSLNGNSVLRLIEDHDQNVWAATKTGLNKYNRTLDKFERVHGLGSSGVEALFVDAGGNLWAGTYGGLAMLSAKTKTWEIIKEFDKKPVSAIQQTSKDDFWVAVRQKGLYHYHLPTKMLTQFVQDPNNPNSLAGNNINELFYDKKTAILWLTTMNGGIGSYHLATKQFVNFKADPNNQNAILANNVRGICQDGPNLLFAVENGGIASYNTETKKITNFLHDEKNASSIAGNSVWAIHKDREGRIWVGMFSIGLSIADKYREKFAQASIPLPSKIINTVIEDRKGRLWVGTANGIALDDNGKTIYYQKDEKNPQSLSGNAVVRLFEDKQGRIWAGTWLNGVNLYEEGKGTFKKYWDVKAKISGDANKNCVYAFGDYVDNKQVLMGSFGGVNILNQQKDALENFVPYIKQTANLDYVKDIHQDRKGNIWVATLKGLFFFDHQQGAPIRYVHSAKDSTGLAINATYSIFEDSKNQIWIGSGAGLHLVLAPGKFKRYSTEDGLPSNEVNGMEEDRRGNLWIITNQGLSRFDPKKQTFRNYSENDGLLSKQFKTNAIFKGKTGAIWLGTINGLNVFHPDSVKDNPHIPTISLTDFKIFNKSVAIGEHDSLLRQHISQTKEITLGHQYSVFSLDFVALGFTQSEKNRYAYRLEGFDLDWNYVGTQRSATYTNLDAGKYVLRVKACNNDGVWNEQGISLKINILPPWWATWWFRALAFLAVTASAYSFYKTRTQFLEKQKAKLEKQVEERTRELASASHEIKAKNEELLASEEELRQNMEELEANKEALEQTLQVVQAKNRVITDSIRYAETIQSAILPQPAEVQGALADHFVLFKPKDVVSGDFYWAHQLETPDGPVHLLAVVDCTGHGVPGAFMSLIGHSVLNEIVGQGHTTQPDQVLALLDERVRLALKQTGSSLTGNVDGMDLGLARLQRPRSGGPVKLDFAGARRPLWYMRAGTGRVQVLPGARKGVGGGLAKADQAGFDMQHLELHPGDRFYLFSDGLPDQPDAQRRKFGTERLRDLLAQNQDLGLDQQRALLEATLAEHQAGTSQRDDINASFAKKS
jgi:ligand-binding sensor domain-containing protein/serine phosphatase RsbU (regulator of sigma subunit)